LEIRLSLANLCKKYRNKNTGLCRGLAQARIIFAYEKKKQ